MSDRLQFKSRVGPDGMLNLHIPLGKGEAGADVLVTISPLAGIARTEPQSDWHEFVEKTYGSCADLGLERQPQKM